MGHAAFDLAHFRRCHYRQNGANASSTYPATSETHRSNRHLRHCGFITTMKTPHQRCDSAVELAECRRHPTIILRCERGRKGNSAQTSRVKQSRCIDGIPVVIIQKCPVKVRTSAAIRRCSGVISALRRGTQLSDLQRWCVQATPTRAGAASSHGILSGQRLAPKQD